MLQFQCNHCKSRFEDKSKLFAHVKAEGHALPADSDDAPISKKGKGKKR